jgi:hypothetical protein
VQLFPAVFCTVYDLSVGGVAIEDSKSIQIVCVDDFFKQPLFDGTASILVEDISENRT